MLAQSSTYATSCNVQLTRTSTSFLVEKFMKLTPRRLLRAYVWISMRYQRGKRRLCNPFNAGTVLDICNELQRAIDPHVNVFLGGKIHVTPRQLLRAYS